MTGAWTGFICLRIGTSVSCCEHGNELVGYIKCGAFHEYLGN
jgi:hypothetical protein